MATDLKLTLAQACVGFALSVCCEPEEKVISVRVRRMEGEWKTAGRLAIYRTKDLFLHAA